MGPAHMVKWEAMPSTGAEMPEESRPDPEPIFPETDLSQLRPPRTMKDKFLNLYYDAVPYFTLNLIWFVLCLPIVTIFPALGGLYYAVLQMNQEGGADGSTVWEGFKKHGWLSVRWGLLVYGVGAVLLVNICFYLNQTQARALYAVAVTVVLLILWVTINQFSFPLLLLQEEQKIFLAIRNGAVISMRQPLMALKVMALSLLISAVSVVLPPLWVFISMAWIVNIRIKTTLKALAALQEKDENKR